MCNFVEIRHVFTNILNFGKILTILTHSAAYTNAVLHIMFNAQFGDFLPDLKLYDNEEKKMNNKILPHHGLKN